TRVDASAAWFFAFAAAGLKPGAPMPTCGGNGGSIGSDDEETIRTVLPTMRASTYAPSSVSVCTTLRCDGSETSISVRTELELCGAMIAAGCAGCGSIQYPPRESTSRCVPERRSCWLQPLSSVS